MFANAISEARSVAGLSLSELAEKSGIPKGTLFNWESGRTIPDSFVRFANVASVLKISPAVFAG